MLRVVGAGRRPAAIVRAWSRVRLSDMRCTNVPSRRSPSRKLLVGVLDPDNRDPFSPRLLDEAADPPDDRVSLVSPRDDAVLNVNDEECGVRPVLESAHLLPH